MTIKQKSNRNSEKRKSAVRPLFPYWIYNRKVYFKNFKIRDVDILWYENIWWVELEMK